MKGKVKFHLNSGLGMVEWLLRMGGGLSGVEVTNVPLLPRL